MYSERASLTPVRKIKYSSKSSKKSQRYTVICLTIIGVCLVGSGAALIVVAVSHDIEDLLILGPLFLVAGVGFTIMMVVIITRPFFEKRALKRKLKKEKQKSKKKKPKTKSALGTIDENVPYITDNEMDLTNTNDFYKTKRPSRVQIYGNKFNFPNNKVSDINQPGVVDNVSEGYASDDDEIASKDSKLKLNPSTLTLYGSAKFDADERTVTPPPPASVVSASDVHYSGSVVNTPINDKIPDMPVYNCGPAVTPLPNEVETSYL